jgi:hypothetical protein
MGSGILKVRSKHYILKDRENNANLKNLPLFPVLTDDRLFWQAFPSLLLRTEH